VVFTLLRIFRVLGTKTATTATIGVNTYRTVVEGVRSGEKPKPEAVIVRSRQGYIDMFLIPIINR
jgi:hypothetical protein